MAPQLGAAGASRERKQERVLLQRWKEVEILEDSGDEVAEEEFTQLKEAWFLDAFSFLFGLSKEEHCWCGYKDVVWPLLEPFYHYFEDSGNNSSLRALWSRLSDELGRCIQCVLQHHKAKEFYATEYLEDVVRPLLSVMQILDEERVATHINDIMQRVKRNTLDGDKDAEELVCVLFEVLMFPSLLEDAEIDKVFIPFLKHVETTHELTLAGNQHYPGVYALLFHPNQDARGIALRLAATVGKLRTLSDLDSIQPILQNYMHALEFDIYDRKDLELKTVKSTKTFTVSATITSRSRRRASFSRESVWIGMKALLGLLEPAVFEGIVEHYPSFISTVLNLVSEATPVFWNALHCLKLLLDALGFKLWLKTTFSPGVMRNTLLGQCFHTREERMHKAIFDLFQPFLQSLEALQDGEYERQRRNLLYFLLQQVPHSSNFSGLMSKKARQIAFLIVKRGYTMNPSCPPVECAHVWGPPLVESVKDTSLYTSIRQPAIVLMQAIIITDSLGLTQLYTKRCPDHPFSDTSESDEQDVDERVDAEAVQVAEDSCWQDFKTLDKLASTDWDRWLCTPLLWIDVLEGVIPSCVPASFSQAVLWARSRLSVVYQSSQLKSAGTCAGMAYSREIAATLQWEKPKGCDDGAGGNCCMNSLNAQCYHTQLVTLFKRCADVYVFRLRECGIVEQWLWEPVVAKVLTLLFLDSDEKLRDFNRHILSHFAKDSGLDTGLKFLCSGQASAASVCSGFKHAIKALIASNSPENFQGLQNLYFIAWKIFTLGQISSENDSSSQNAPQLLSPIQGGGFLKQPEYVHYSDNLEHNVTTKKKDNVTCKFYSQLSSYLWPLLVKSLTEGRQFVDDSANLMTFARMFDLLPLVFRSMIQFLSKRRLDKLMSQAFGGFRRSSGKSGGSEGWLYDLVGWGEIESITIHRRWKVALTSILKDLSECTFQPESDLLKEAMKLIQTGSFLHLDVREKIIHIVNLFLVQSSEGNTLRNYSPKAAQRQVVAVCVEDHHDVRESTELGWQSNIIHLSDDDTEDGHSKPEHSKLATSEMKLMQKLLGDGKSLQDDSPSLDLENAPKEIVTADLLTMESEIDVVKVSQASLAEQPKKHKRPVSVRRVPSAFLKSHKNATLDKYFSSMKNESLKPDDIWEMEGKERYDATVAGMKSLNLPDASDPHASLQVIEHADVETCTVGEGLVPSQVQETEHVKGEQRITRLQPEKSIIDLTNVELTENSCTTPCKTKIETILRELVADTVDDPLEAVLDAAKVQQASLSKTAVLHPKRQLVRLQLPDEHVRGNFTRLRGAAARPGPPRLDEWYRRILSLNYFSVVGMDFNGSPETAPAEPLMKIPSIFQSADHYMDVFRPLVMEELKAQLQRAHEEVLASDVARAWILRLMSLEKVDDFQLCRFTAEAGADGIGRTCFENDLLLLSRQPFKNASQSAHAIGKVERRERDGKSKSVILVLKLFLPPTNSRLAKARRLMVDRSEWHAIRLMSITPQLREFQALSSVTHNPFLPIILNPTSFCTGSTASQLECRVQAVPPTLEGLSKSLQVRLRSDYNESQLKAINDVTRIRSGISHKLSLVQGPPGTGKTRTIIAIVSALLAVTRTSCSLTYQHGDSLPSKMVNSPRVSAVARKPVSQSVAISRSWQDAAIAKELMKEATVNISKGAQAERSRRARVLVCAQSNAAVDELVSRIIEGGLYDSDGHVFTPYLVRVGNVKTVHPDSLRVFIDTLVEERMEGDKLGICGKKEENVKGYVEMLRNKLENVIESIRLLETQRSQCLTNEKKGTKAQGDNLPNQRHEDGIVEEGASSQSREGSNVGQSLVQTEATLKVKLNNLYKQRRALCADLAGAEAKDRKITEESRIMRQTLRKDIIKEAEVVVTTLSGCGGDIYTTCMESFTGQNRKKEIGDVLFDAVVIDEAAQALEPATLIPLQLLKPACTNCVMVGDPKQLPATVLSQLASRFSYECSMFERLQLGGYPVTLLSTQYRMHPEICQFPSAHFYQNQLTDGEGLTEGNRFAAFHKDRYFGPYVVFDVVEGYERVNSSSVSQSLFNEAEVEVAYEIFENLKKRYPAEVLPKRFGVITPYKQQLLLLRQKFLRSFGQSISTEIEFNTVDGFQGREVDILILSTVRASSRNVHNSQLAGIGFVADVRRMNVALTRARFSLWIVGNANTLQGSPSWAALLDNAKARGLLHTVKRPYKTFFLDGSVRTSHSSPTNMQNTQTDSNIRAGFEEERKFALSKPAGNITTYNTEKIGVPNRGKLAWQDAPQGLAKKQFMNARTHKTQDHLGTREKRSKGEDGQHRKCQVSVALSKVTEDGNATSTLLEHDKTQGQVQGVLKNRTSIVHAYKHVDSSPACETADTKNATALTFPEHRDGRSKLITIGAASAAGCNAAPRQKHKTEQQLSKADDCGFQRKISVVESDTIGRTVGMKLNAEHLERERVARKRRTFQIEQIGQAVSENPIGKDDHRERPESHKKIRQGRYQDKQTTFSNSREVERREHPFNRDALSKDQKDSCLVHNRRMGGGICYKPEQNKFEDTKIVGNSSKGKGNVSRSITLERTARMGISESEVTGLVSMPSVTHTLLRTSQGGKQGEADYQEVLKSKEQSLGRRQQQDASKMIPSASHYFSEIPRSGSCELEEQARLETKGLLGAGVCHQQKSLHETNFPDHVKDLNYEWEQFQKVLAQSKTAAQPLVGSGITPSNTQKGKE